MTDCVTCRHVSTGLGLCLLWPLLIGTLKLHSFVTSCGMSVTSASHLLACTNPMIAFDVFHSVQGNQGKLGKASKQQLDNTFGTSRDDDVVKFMLENGTVQGTASDVSGGGMDKARCVVVLSPAFSSAMLIFISRYGQMMDTRGSGGGLRGHSGK